MHSNGESAIAIGGRVMSSYGDDCPGPCRDGIGVHQAVIPIVDEDGFIVMPQYVALCCECRMEQFITKYGLENVQPCGCEIVPLQVTARLLREDAELKMAIADKKIADWRETFLREREQKASGTITEIARG